MEIPNKKFIIWTNDLNYEDFREDLEERYPDATEEERIQYMYEENAEQLECERRNLSIEVEDDIIVFADIGCWNGRIPFPLSVEGRKISDCLYSELDILTWYLDDRGDLICEAKHHDGTNIYLYRMFKPSAGERARANIIDLFCVGLHNRRAITRVTSRLGDHIAKVYGWNISQKGIAKASV